jgi:hypothetical protein
MDQPIRNKLRNVVTQCRKLLEEAVAQVLQGQFGIHASGKKDEVHVEDEARMKNLSEEDKGYRRDILAHLEHIEALGYKAKDALAQLVRESGNTFARQPVRPSGPSGRTENNSCPDERLLREMAYVLHLIRTVKREILAGQVAPN